MRTTFHIDGSESRKSPPFVVVFTAIVVLVYGYASLQLKRQIDPLAQRCQRLEHELTATREHRIELEEMVASLSDPAAEEYALIAELGRVPEGKCKIFVPSQ